MGRVSDTKERLMEAVRELIWTCSYGRTTIDQICNKAKVKKGSFYHFFDGKAGLAEAALDAEWKAMRPRYDAMFSPTIPPLERLWNYCDYSYQLQKELKAKYGYVLGCPFCCLGSEVSTREHGLRNKVQEIMGYAQKYLESTVRDAHAAGVIEAPDAAAKTRMLSAYHKGLLTQARIQDDAEVLHDMARSTFELLGVKLPEKTKLCA